MSAGLWRYFLEDDVDSFRQLLANATYTLGPQKASGGGGGSTGNPAAKIGSPVPLATPPKSPIQSRKVSSSARYHPATSETGHGIALTRADVNWKDRSGRTILHHASSSTSETALGFVTALLEIPFIDLYIQDLESGWTALHRALYFGNVAVAQALMLRDSKNVIDYTTGSLNHNTRGLVKIKDHEGNSPFEVFGLTIASRVLLPSSNAVSASIEDEESIGSISADDHDGEQKPPKRIIKPMVNLLGDEIFAFGSNKNLSLGIGDEDDRQFPERLIFERPEHLLRRFHQEYMAGCRKASVAQDLPIGDQSNPGGADLPALIRAQPLVFQDVVMSKFHTAVLTNDPESNLFICGYGPGGRLGTGDEATRFSFVCVETGGLRDKKVIAIALGQDHSIAVTSSGEVLTWGSNRHGQLGYSLPQPPTVHDAPTQTAPRQLFGALKREVVVGAAASSIHSAVFTCSALYTFGKNEGQLGLMDADARSLGTQIAPRRVGVSVLSSPIRMVSAIDQATSILLESHDVIVLTHFGWTRVVFPLQSFTNYFLKGSPATRYDPAGNFIAKITSGGNTVCAMSAFGEVFTVDVAKKIDFAPASVSTTNPTKARNALPNPTRVWSIKKSHMTAHDVAVGQDGTIILCTVSGSVWRKEKRARIKDNRTSTFNRTRDYKFVRISNLTRAVAVRSNAYGAFTAIRRDCDVTRDQIAVNPQTLWNDIYPLLSFREYRVPEEDSDTEHMAPRFWTPARKTDSPALVRQAVLLSKDAEMDLQNLINKYPPLLQSQYDLWITSNVSKTRIPAHAFLVKARSKVLRQALSEIQQTYYFSIPGCLSIEYGQDGQIRVEFQGADFLTILNLVYYVYTENLVDVWHHAHKSTLSAARYRQVRVELMKIAAHLELRQLEHAVRFMVEPVKCLHADLEVAILDQHFYSDADVTVKLAHGAEAPAHSALLCRRCPFFEGLFHGRAGGRWISTRRGLAENATEPVKVDLKHIRKMVFQLVRRHIYADTGEEIFDAVVTKDIDELIDIVLDVMAVANELMLDRLAQICQKAVGRFVTTRNICQLLNAVAPCSVTEFKHVGLEYLCLNLESMLEHRLLEELDEDLLVELDQNVRQNQLAYLPFARSGRAMAILLDQHPDLLSQIEQERHRKLVSLRLNSRWYEDEGRPASNNKLRAENWETHAQPRLSRKVIGASQKRVGTPVLPPALALKDGHHELLFEMDEEHFAHGHPRVDTISTPVRPIIHRNEGLLRAEQEIAASLDTQASSLPDSITRRSQQQYSPSDAASNHTRDRDVGPRVELPWSVAPLGSPKVDFNDIMAQDSANRSSNLTQAMNTRDGAQTNGNYKMSQKDRKRLQHQQMQGHKGVHPPSSGAQRATEDLLSSWQKSQSGAESIPDRAIVHDAVADSHSPAVQRPPARSAMTMRQTIAGNQPPFTPHPPKQSHSVSSVAFTLSSKPSPPQIQSIRHFPPPSNIVMARDSSSSMAQILSQQAMEKTAIKEAAAKRSLQDIQQEQEFQEWWDSESRKVQEAEAIENEAARRERGKVHRRRGAGRRTSGRSAPSDVVAMKASGTGDASHPEPGPGVGMRRGKGEGKEEAP